MAIDPGSADPARNDMLAMITEGMKVVDSGGEDVGTVSFVHMADINDPDDNPAALDADVGLLDVFDPDENGDVTQRMRQQGYVRIDASGWFSGDKYVEPQEIASVEGDTVRLAVDKDSIGQHA